MKKSSKVISIVLVLILIIGTFTGCGQKTTEDGKQSTTGNVAESTDSEQKEDSATENTGSKTDPEAEEDSWTWPLAEQRELSIWTWWENSYVTDPNELKGIQEIEKNTNVHVNWVVMGAIDAVEKFGLMIASGDYPDIIRSMGEMYGGGLEQAYNDGVIVELTEYIPKYMPTYQSIRTSSEKLAKDTVSDDGRMLGLYTIASYFGDVRGQDIWGGMSIRQDWLNDLGLEAPETIDEWYTVLKAFKENYNCEAPLLIGSTYGYDLYQDFISAYGVLGEFYNDNGTVKFGPLEEGYKQWVQLFRDWYAEGLIDPNFLTNDAAQMGSGDYLATDRAGASANLYLLTADAYKMYGMTQDEDFYLKAVPAPVLNKGDIPQVGYNMSEITKETIAVTTNCEDIELACRYLDYWYTEEAMLLDSVGIEGESYVDNGDGTYSLGPIAYEMVTNGDIPIPADVMSYYNLGISHFGLYNWGREVMAYEGNLAMEACDIWNVAQYDLMLPPTMTMTTDESAEFYTIYPAIQTLVSENTVQFISGSKSMDEYDAFVQSLYDYGIEQCIAFKQAALDRYNAR